LIARKVESSPTLSNSLNQCPQQIPEKRSFVVDFSHFIDYNAIFLSATYFI